MPVAKRYGLNEVMDACRYYFEKTGRRLTFEYSLVQGVNDNLDEAKALVRLIKDQHGHVNLIPVNPIKEREYVQSGRQAIEAFKNQLEKSGINVTVRREMGRDIDLSLIHILSAIPCRNGWPPCGNQHTVRKRSGG